MPTLPVYAYQLSVCLPACLPACLPLSLSLSLSLSLCCGLVQSKPAHRSFSPAEPSVSGVQSDESPAELSHEQQEIVRLAVDEGRSLFFTGSAGMLLMHAEPALGVIVYMTCMRDGNADKHWHLCDCQAPARALCFGI
ncbi:hypothetical protein BC831DRAFT_100899 [Entophlyctis helioformis]|nr:hypothetical protein BC831DRAFT_100899 [Entophlyctis helioformis]